MSQKPSSVRVVLMAIAGNSVITLAKFVAWFFTHSPSLLAESIHSLADTFNQILLYIGVRHSQSGPSKKFPMGKGSAQYVWNLVSAVGIFFIGFGVTTYHGVHSLLNPSPAHNVGPMAIAVLLFSFLIEGYVFLAALKAVNKKRDSMPFLTYLKEGDDPTAVAILFEDGVAVLGVILALIGVGLSNYLNSSWPDAVASIFIGLLLGVMALSLSYANGRLLIGVSTTAQEEEKIRDFIEHYPHVEKVANLHTYILGPNLLRLSAEVEFHGTALIDKNQIKKDVELIRQGEDPTPILVDTAERMVRVVGKEINQLEKSLKKEFPALVAIDLEVN